MLVLKRRIAEWIDVVVDGQVVASFSPMAISGQQVRIGMTADDRKVEFHRREIRRPDGREGSGQGAKA